MLTRMQRLLLDDVHAVDEDDPSRGVRQPPSCVADGERRPGPRRCRRPPAARPGRGTGWGAARREAEEQGGEDDPPRCGREAGARRCHAARLRPGRRGSRGLGHARPWGRRWAARPSGDVPAAGRADGCPNYTVQTV
jgi:hypothetical protein